MLYERLVAERPAPATDVSSCPIFRSAAEPAAGRAPYRARRPKATHSPSLRPIACWSGHSAIRQLPVGTALVAYRHGADCLSKPASSRSSTRPRSTADVPYPPSAWMLRLVSGFACRWRKWPFRCQFPRPKHARALGSLSEFAFQFNLDLAFVLFRFQIAQI